MYRILNKNIDLKFLEVNSGGYGMIYSNVSCNVENTLKKFINLDIDKMLNTDYFALITITEYKKIFIDGEINYSSVNTNLIIELLQQRCQEVYELKDGMICKFSGDDKNKEIIVIPIRKQENYKVFCISCSLNSGYGERDLAIMKFISKVSYENVLLNNEIVKERNYLKNLFDSAQSFIIGIDVDGKITTANEGVYKVFHLRPKEIIGKGYEILILKEDLAKTERLISNVINKNKSYTAEEEIFLNPKRGKVFIDITISPINNNKGEVVGVVFIGTDVTKRKIYEKEIEQLNQFALLGEVAAGVAHDIKNPLMSIRGCARILQKKLSLERNCKDFIEPIVKEVDRIDEVIKQMMSYSFITQEDIYSYLDINEVLEKCFNVVSFHKQSKYIHIEKEFCEKLPLIKGNNVQLQQAFLNILFNSVQAIETEGVINIKSYNLQKDQKVLVVISDNGKGISSDRIDKIFEPFYTTKIGGTGLGLSIVKRVIKKYHGEIIVNSKVEEGTEIKVYLPYRNGGI